MAAAPVEAGVRAVLIPRDNARDLSQIPENVREVLGFVQVEGMGQVLLYTLERLPRSARDALLG